MKITVYTVSDCQFSQAEKEYLKLHNLPFEEKNLEQNREWLTEMLAVSNNFAGTPVTKIEKDDGTITVLKGFTKEEFDKELGLGEQVATQVNTQINLPEEQNPQPQPTETQPMPQTTNQMGENQPETLTSSSTENQQTPSENQAADQKLNDILSSLEQKAQTNQTTPPTSQNPTPPPSDLPNIPDFSDKQ
jgi:glutaredoxin